MKIENKNIAQLFVFCRECLGLSQRKMAEILAVNQSTVSRIEKGEIFPKKDLIKKLEAEMELDLGQIILMRIKNM